MAYGIERPAAYVIVPARTLPALKCLGRIRDRFLAAAPTYELPDLRNIIYGGTEPKIPRPAQGDGSPQRR
jgi:hypothetical protein